MSGEELTYLFDLLDKLRKASDTLRTEKYKHQQ